jgi:DNA-binding response OmpR family regulator
VAEILLVDDERTVREGLRRLLESEGFAVRTARDGTDALVRLSEKRPDAVLLDVMMPKLNGFALCAEIRKTDMLLPVVFLTAKDSEVDEIRGMGIGADDYVSKNAGEEVLLARLRRALERSVLVDSGSKGVSVLELGTVRVDLERRKVLRDGEEEALTASESDILKCLASAPGRPFTADELLSFLRGEGYVGDPATVRVHIMNLRRKLGRAGAMIANLPKGGYYLVGT